MSFKDCIRSAVETGRISAEKGAEAEAEFDAGLVRAADEGLTGGAAHDRAAELSVQNAMNLTAEAKWRRINEMRKAHRLWQELREVRDYDQALVQKTRDIEIASERIMSQAHSMYVQNLEVFRPRAVGLYHPKAYNDDIVRALYGENVGKVFARELAEEYANVQEFFRTRANAEGASIPENPNRRLTQEHDRQKLRRAGEDTWVADHLRDGVLDWDIMQYQGKYIPKAQRETALRKAYQTLVNDGYNKIKPGQGWQHQSLASQLSGERFLYYKTADAWLTMNKAYGRGNVFEQMIGHMHVMSMNIAMMEQLGPNPEAGAGLVRNIIRSRAAEVEGGKTRAGGSRGASQTAKADIAIDGFNTRLEILSRRVLSGEENILATVPSTVRQTIVPNLLGSAFLSALGDLGFSRHIAMANRLPGMRTTTNYIRYLLPFGRRRKQLAIRSGLIAESASAVASGYQRYFGPATGTAITRRLADVTFRATLLTPSTQAAKWSFGMEFLGMFADNAKVAFDDLPFRTMLERYSITAADWDAFRTTPLLNDQGAEFLRPIDMWNAGDARAKRIADKFQDMTIDMIRKAVPTVGVETQAALVGQSAPGTLPGELLRTVGMVQSFPVAMYHIYWRDMMLRSSMQGRLSYFGSYLLWTTIGGAFIVQLKALAAGRDPEDMTDPRFLGKAMMYGGTFGLMTDLIIQGVGATLGGPLPDTVDELRRAVVQTFDGNSRTDPSGELLSLMRKIVPVTNWWQVRLLLERAVLDELQRMSDPQAYQRRKLYERQRAMESGQEPYWPIGRSPRAPNLGAAVGQ